MSGSPPPIPDFVLLRCIGRGSYGEVWLARGVTGLHRAVKIVYRASFSEVHPYEREFSGIKKFQAVSHAQENLIDILHVGRNDAAGFFYYVMELADPAGSVPPSRMPGSDLDAGGYQSGTLKHLLRTRGRLPVAECRAIAGGLARAVGYLHAHGLIHRDIKPSNVIFVNGVPKLADIGLVAGFDEARSFVGTEGFVPPEGPGSVVADLFALGRLLYEMSTGRDRLDYPKLPEDFDALPERAAFVEFNEVVIKAGDPERQRRYQSADELIHDLLLLEAGKSVRRLRVLESRFALALRTTAVALVITALAVGAWIWAAYQAREARHNYDVSEQHRLKAEAALRDVLLNEVRSSRQSGWAGQRLDSLRMLRNVSFLTNTVAFRSEAMASLTLPDVRPGRRIPLPKGARLTVDPNIERYVTNDAAHSLYVRSIETDELLAILPTPGPPLRQFAFESNPQRLAVGYSDQSFVIWDLSRVPRPTASPAPPLATMPSNAPAARWESLPADRRPVPLRFPANTVEVTWPPDGSDVAVLGRDDRLRRFDRATGAERSSVGVESFLRGLRFSASGFKFAAVRSNDCLVFRAGTGEKLFTLVHPLPVSSMCWHPDGRRLITTCFDFKVRLWDTVTGMALNTFEDHEAEAIEVDFDATGGLFATSSWDDTTRLWAPESTRALLRFRGSGNQLRLSTDARRLSYSTWDHKDLVVEEIIPGREVTTYERLSGTYGVTFSPDGKFLVAGADSGLRIWRLPYAGAVASIPIYSCTRPLFSPDGTMLYAGGRGEATEWPFQVGPDQSLLSIGPGRELTDVPEKFLGMVVPSPDGKRLAGALEDRLKVYDRDGTKWKESWTATNRYIGASFHPKSEWLAAAHGHWSVDIFDRSGRVVTNLPTINAAAARFTPDGRWLVLIVTNQYQAFQTGSWQPGPTIPIVSCPLQRECIDFAAGGSLAACRTHDRELSLVDPVTWQIVARLFLPLATTKIALTPDGNRLAVATEKRGVQVWDLGLIRAGLADVGLDWHSTAESATAPPESGPRNLGSMPPHWASDVTVYEPRTNALNPSIASRIPPRDSGTPSGCLDLTLFYNGSPHDGWIPGFGLGPTPDHTLPIPLGVNRWAGIDFDVRGVIQLSSSVLTSRKGAFPSEADGIPVGRRLRRIHFLHGTDWSAKAGTFIGGYVIRYTNGAEEYVQMLYGQDVLDWWKEPPAIPGGASATNQLAGVTANRALNVAWTGENPASRRQKCALRVYRSTWENPRWDLVVRGIDFFSTRTVCGPFLLAITVEE